MRSSRSTCALALALSLTGCAGGLPSDEEGNNDGSMEEVGTAGHGLLGSAHAQAFGAEYGTPGTDLEYLHFGEAVATADLDGDGAADLVVGTQGAITGGQYSAGAVTILWGQKAQSGSFGGLSNSGATTLTQGASNVEPYDNFGAALAAGDFNCDGHQDLAVGAPGDAPPGEPDAVWAGNVTILYGPDFSYRQIFWQGTGSPGAREAGDAFGTVLAAGNFNGDTYSGRSCDDLAIAAPYEDVADAVDAGAVTILYGRFTGLNTQGARAAQMFHQDTGTIFGVAEDGDLFGSALAVGDFNNDGKDDLAIGARWEDYEAAPAASNVGLVHVIKGSGDGLTDAGNVALELSQLASIGLQSNAQMGSALASGDFDGDGDDDLAAGVPGLTVGGAGSAGGVVIYREVAGQLLPTLVYHQDHPAMPGAAESGDSCGASLTAGDFDGDGKDDLASGCPGEDVGSASQAGAVNVAYFGISSGAFAVTAGQLWHQDSAGIPDACDALNRLGVALAAGDFNGDGEDDLAAGAPEDGGAQEGVVNVFYGAP